MASTKRTISEQVLRRLSSGNPSIASKVHSLEIDAAVMQVVNTALRAQFFESLNLGESVLDTCVQVTYENVPVVAYKGVSKCTLPGTPIQLLRNLGIRRISVSDDILEGAFIPARDGEFEMLKGQRNPLSTLLGQIGFKVKGKDIIFNKDLTAQTPAITEVDIDILALDYSQFTDYEILPISADIEAQVIDTVVKMFAGIPTKTQIIDSTSDTK